MTRRDRHAPARQYPRTARLNEVVREIVADELERIDDDRLIDVAVTGVEVDADLRHATVFFDNLSGVDGEAAVLAAFGELRVKLQAAIGRQARFKRTPQLGFTADPAVRAGERIDAVLRDIEPVESTTNTAPGDTAPGDAAPGDGAPGDGAPGDGAPGDGAE